MDNLLIIDFYNFLLRNVPFTTGDTLDELDFTAFYKCVRNLIHLLKELDFPSIVVVKDEKPYLRSKLFPEYKKVKPTKPIKFSSAVKENAFCLFDFFSVLSVPIFQKIGYEGDDWIAEICKSKHQYHKTIYVLSNDSDLNQLLTIKNVCLLKNKTRITHENVLTIFPYLPAEDIVDFYALTGTHNGIPGIKGVGNVKAKKLVESAKSTTYEHFLKNDEYRDFIFYQKLIQLPIFTRDRYLENFVKGYELSRPKISLRDVRSFLSAQGFVLSPVQRSILANYS